MKSRGRTKIGSKRGNPGYRTPSFFKNQARAPLKIEKIGGNWLKEVRGR